MISRRRVQRYEVVVEQGGRPNIDGVFDDEAAALERAKYLLAQARFSRVRVLRVNQAGKEETVFEKTYMGGGSVTTISHIDTAAPCADILQVYGFESRMTLLRLLRRYWDEQQVIPAEQIHRYFPLRYLEREAILFNPAVARLATLQAQSLGVKPFDRQDELMRWFVRIKELAQEGATALAPFDRALMSGGTGALLAAAVAERPPEERDRIVTHAFATALEPHREWRAKVSALLHFHDRRDGESTRLVDEFLAETVDGREPVKAVIGYAPDLASALMALLATLRGELDDRLPHTPELLALSDAIAAGGFRRLEQALLNRIVGALAGRHPLTRQGKAQEAKAFNAIADRLAVPDGFRGGAATAEALTRRAKMALGVNGEDLSFEDTVTRLTGRFSAPAARIGFLLDLAASDYGHKRVSHLIGQVATIFSKAASVHDLSPVGTPPAEARQRFADRLDKAGVPRALADALIAKMASMPDEPAAAPHVVTAETIDILARRMPIRRLVLSCNGHQFRLPDHGAELVIGRSHDCHILIDNAAASRRHAVVAMDGDGFVLEDRSRNGTMVRPEAADPVSLGNGDRLILAERGEIVIGSREAGDDPARITWEVVTA